MDERSIFAPANDHTDFPSAVNNESSSSGGAAADSNRPSHVGGAASIRSPLLANIRVADSSMTPRHLRSLRPSPSPLLSQSSLMSPMTCAPRNTGACEPDNGFPAPEGEDEDEDGAWSHLQNRLRRVAAEDFITDASTLQAESGGRTSPYYYRPSLPETPKNPADAFQVASDKEMLREAMSIVDFLPFEPERPAKLVVIATDGTGLEIEGLDLALLEDRCVILATGFECNRAGIFKNSLEVKSRLLAISFLRFLHTGSYLVTADDGVSMIPPSLLLHAEMYQLGDVYDLAALKKAAQANVTRISEFADCYPDPPDDLCEASRFIYSRLPGHDALKEIILHYCVGCFQRHNLKADLAFRQLVDEVALFGIDLLRTNIQRGFCDEGAADIIQLPINTAPRPDYLKAEQQALIDFIYHIWGPQTFAIRCGDDSTASSSPSSPRLQGYALVRRPKIKTSGHYTESDATSSEGESFDLVYRPRPHKSRSKIESADEADISDWSEHTQSDAEYSFTERRGKLPIKSTAEKRALSRSSTTIRPRPRPQTPTQANPHPPQDDLYDSSDAGFTVLKSHGKVGRAFDSSDDFEFI